MLLHSLFSFSSGDELAGGDGLPRFARNDGEGRGWLGRWMVAGLVVGWWEAWGSDPNSGQRCLRSAKAMNEIGL
jgi:hypothetical protein